MHTNQVDVGVTNFRYSFAALTNGVRHLIDLNIGSAATCITEAAVTALPLVGTTALLVKQRFSPLKSSDLIEQRRLKVKNQIIEPDHYITQLYFLAHQHEACEGNPNNQIKDLAMPSTSAITASYLDENLASLITLLKQYRHTLHPLKQAIISEILEPLEDALEIAIAVSCVDDATSDDMRLAMKERLITLLWERYQNLEVGSKMLIPAGYLNGNPYDLNRPVGHAVLIEIKKIEEGKVEFRVFNTGEGTNFHAKTQSMIYPFAIANIPISVIDLDFFNKLAQFSNQTEYGQKNKIDNLYYLLFWRFGPQENYHVSSDVKYFSQGPVNSCAHQSILAWAKSSLGDHQELFFEFTNHIVRDRLWKLKARSGCRKVTIFIKQPYVIYSLTRQQSLLLTVYGASRRVLEGPSVYPKFITEIALVCL